MQKPSKSGVREIARLAGVSLGTVDRALHGRKDVSETTRERVLAVARKLGYQPNLTARALAAGKSTTRIGICIPREIHFFYDQLRDGILDEIQRYSHLGLDALYEPVPNLGVGELAALRRMMRSEVRAILLTPGHPAQLAPLIDEAETKHNVRVICLASDDSTSARSTSISVEPQLNGSLAAELMAKITAATARVAIFTGMLATEDHARKVQGFVSAFQREAPAGQIVGVIEDHQEFLLARRKCVQLLKSQPNLSGIYVSTANCLPVCEALEEQGAAGRIRVIATDLFQDLVPYFERGVISASIYQHPYLQGQTAIRLLVDHLLQGAALPHAHYLNPAVVLKSNLRLFREISA